MPFLLLPTLASFLVCLGLAALVLVKNRSHPTNWAFAFGMFSFAVMECGNAMTMFSDSIHARLIWQRVSLSGDILIPGSWVLFSLVFARANYDEYLRRWRHWLVLIGVATGGFILLVGTPLMLAEPVMLASDPGVESDVLSGAIRVGTAGYIFYALQLMALVVVLANLEHSLRSAYEPHRWQIKFLLLGLGVICAFMVYRNSQILLLSSLPLALIPLSSIVILCGTCLMAYSFARHHLLDVDIYVSRSVVYNSVTVLMVGGYLLTAGFAVKLFQSYGVAPEQYFGSLLVILGGVGLAALLLSTEFRVRLRGSIQRNFYAYKYDYRAKWIEFTERIGAERDVTRLQGQFVDFLSETMGAKQVSFWVYEDETRDFRMIGKIGFRVPDESIMKVAGDANPLIHLLRTATEPLAVQNMKANPKTENVVTENAVVFDATGAVYIAPLKAGDRVLAFVTVGEDREGARYQIHDIDLLKAVTAHAASQLLNFRFTKELAVAKETEAFHALSTFFVHDLKNFTGTLSLLVQNAEHHLGNPDFQRQAMKTIAKTVTKMEGLTNRLKTMSRPQDLVYHDVDINTVVGETVSSLEHALDVSLRFDATSVPGVNADPEHLHRVFENLILNAREAIKETHSEDGSITVRTGVKDRWVTAAVSDTGCGMSEHLRNEIFAPFKTTKSTGLGIGLFQCKRIIEAHGGRIEVVSELGAGSTFTVMLPVA